MHYYLDVEADHVYLTPGEDICIFFQECYEFYSGLERQFGTNADLLGFLGCADVNNLCLFFDVEVRAFWIIIIRLELRRWFIILIYACIVLLPYAMSSERISFSKVESVMSKECMCSASWP